MRVFRIFLLTLLALSILLWILSISVEWVSNPADRLYILLGHGQVGLGWGEPITVKRWQILSEGEHGLLRRIFGTFIHLPISTTRIDTIPASLLTGVAAAALGLSFCKRRSKSPDECPSCGYNLAGLHGLGQAPCPECGALGKADPRGEEPQSPPGQNTRMGAGITASSRSTRS